MSKCKAPLETKAKKINIICFQFSCFLFASFYLLFVQNEIHHSIGVHVFKWQKTVLQMCNVSQVLRKWKCREPFKALDMGSPSKYLVRGTLHPIRPVSVHAPVANIYSCLNSKLITLVARVRLHKPGVERTSCM